MSEAIQIKIKKIKLPDDGKLPDGIFTNKDNLEAYLLTAAQMLDPDRKIQVFQIIKEE
jgi:hypothetical protein